MLAQPKASNPSTHCGKRTIRRTRVPHAASSFQLSSSPLLVFASSGLVSSGIRAHVSPFFPCLFVWYSQPTAANSLWPAHHKAESVCRLRAAPSTLFSCSLSSLLVPTSMIFGLLWLFLHCLSHTHSQRPPTHCGKRTIRRAKSLQAASCSFHLHRCTTCGWLCMRTTRRRSSRSPLQKVCSPLFQAQLRFCLPVFERSSCVVFGFPGLCAAPSTIPAAQRVDGCACQLATRRRSSRSPQQLGCFVRLLVHSTVYPFLCASEGFLISYLVLAGIYGMSSTHNRIRKSYHAEHVGVHTHKKKSSFAFFLATKSICVSCTCVAVCAFCPLRHALCSS